MSDDAKPKEEPEVEAHGPKVGPKLEAERSEDDEPDFEAHGPKVGPKLGPKVGPKLGPKV